MRSEDARKDFMWGSERNTQFIDKEIGQNTVQKRI